MRDALLIELLTEELPPKSLKRLSEAFANGIFSALKEQDFLSTDSRCTPFATPRRLAVLITDVADKQPDKQIERKGPSLAAAFDASGKPTHALLGFAKSCGVDAKALKQGADAKGKPCYVFISRQKSQTLGAAMIAILQNALPKLPVAETMRWGSGEAAFVRPVHGFLMLHGKKALKERLPLLEMQSGQAVTLGHRFLSNGAVKLPHAGKYESLLETKGKVIANFDKRKEQIREELEKHAGGAQILMDEALLDEVTALVEWPAVCSGAFDENFLDIPHECLILTMKQHQKYFPLSGNQGDLLPRFLIVSNLEIKSHKNIIHGNERVLRARLSDAKFFFDQDRKTKLESRVSKLANVIFHNKLGTQLDRVERLEYLAQQIASRLGANTGEAFRAAMLCKVDLLTDMVGEFPELQGIMGRYYALHDGESDTIATAICQHYWPRFAGDKLPESELAISLSLADRIDSLVALYGAGQVPTGEKDPFGLRRQALGIIRILIEKSLPLNLGSDLLEPALSRLGHPSTGTLYDELFNFIKDRLKGYLRDQGFSPDEIESVVHQTPYFNEIMPRLRAVRAFKNIPEGKTLAAAHKRIRNILKSAGRINQTEPNLGIMDTSAERELFRAMRQIPTGFNAESAVERLRELSKLGPKVDVFFDKVLVMAEDEMLRSNRLALLRQLEGLMNQVADISKLAV